MYRVKDDSHTYMGDTDTAREGQRNTRIVKEILLITHHTKSLTSSFPVRPELIPFR